MALLENKKDPNIVSPISVDVESNVDKREVIKLLPGVNQTQPLEKFFSSTF